MGFPLTFLNNVTKEDLTKQNKNEGLTNNNAHLSKGTGVKTFTDSLQLNLLNVFLSVYYYKIKHKLNNIVKVAKKRYTES